MCVCVCVCMHPIVNQLGMFSQEAKQDTGGFTLFIGNVAFLVSTKQDFPWPVVLRHNWQCQKKNNNYGMLMVTDMYLRNHVCILLYVIQCKTRVNMSIFYC